MKNETAFPNPHLSHLRGMLLRDYFAVKIMQNLTNEYGHFVDDSRWKDSAERSYEIADLMIEARNK